MNSPSSRSPRVRYTVARETRGPGSLESQPYIASALKCSWVAKARSKMRARCAVSFRECCRRNDSKARLISACFMAGVPARSRIVFARAARKAAGAPERWLLVADLASQMAQADVAPAEAAFPLQLVDPRVSALA